MRTRIALRSALLLIAALLLAGVASPLELPDTPAARRLVEVLEHINAGDRAELMAYALREFAPGMLEPAPDEIVDYMMGQYRANGGYDVRRVLQSAPEQITVLVQGRRATDRWLRLAVGAEPAPPHRVQGFFVFVASAAMAEDEGGAVAPDSLPARFARLLDAMAAEGRFSGSVALARGDRTVLERAWGLADRARGVPNRTDTPFGVASVGKTFTAVAIAQLAERGRLRLEDPASRYVPDWLAPEARGVTIAQLLEHRSGLGDFLHRLERGRRYDRLEDYRAFAAGDIPAFAPGSGFRYSNVGYLILGAVIEELSGEPWERYLQGHVFDPAGMRATTALRPAPGAGGIAAGEAEGGAAQPEGRGSPAGGSAATAADLASFARALRAGTLIARSSLDSLLAPRVEMTGTGRMYGRGFTVSRELRPRVWGHAGGIPGTSALLEVYEDGGWILAVLSNTTEGASLAGDAWRDLLGRAAR